MKERQQGRQQRSKKTWLLTLSSLMVFGLTSMHAQAANVSYADVDSKYWAASAITDLTEKGIAAGSDDNHFYPAANVTRAQFVKLLVMALKLPLTTHTASTFSDVSTSDWFFPYVQTANESDIAHGVDTTHFAPDLPISREDMMVMLVNALHLQTISPDLLNAMLPFNDVNDIQDYAKQAVALGKELQLVSGMPDGSFQPAASTSRAQASVVIDRMLMVPSDRLQAMTQTSFHPNTHVEVTMTPSTKLEAGQQAQLQLRVVDGNDQPVLLANPVPVTLSISSPSMGTLAAQSLVIPPGGTVTTHFTSNQQTGDATITATPDTSAIDTTLSGSTKLTLFSQSAPQLVSGKGMWMMWSDWHNNNTDQLIAKAKSMGITHLYIEVATSWHGEGFYGSDALDSLLPKAHAAGIKVIGWTYDSLQNPSGDAAFTIQVAQYRTPSGDVVDGIAPDIEETTSVNQSSVTTYSSALRNALGQSYPLILCTYPPSWRTGFPWATFGQYYDVIAPMDYWHNHYRTYTYNDAFTEVQNTIQQIREYTGRPNIPITMIGEGYDMFTDDSGSNSPTPDEIRGSMDAAKQNGAYGYSLYRWGTMTDSEWQAFGSYSW